MPNLLPAALIFFVWMGSLCVAGLPLAALEGQALLFRVLALGLAAPIFALMFLGLAGTLSLIGRRGIIRGRFPRQQFHKVYFFRRIYGCCWTMVFYFKPLYFVFLSVPILKKTLFRLFGYKGPMNFVIYPDTWVRDLPLLHFGEGSYCSNRSTVGTNMCLKDGDILVDRIFMGDRSLLGHLSMLGPGVRLEDDVEIGVGIVLGVRCRMKKGVRIGSGSSVNHGTVFGERSEIGGHSHVGLRVEVGDDIKIPPGANIPAGAVIKSAADVNRYISAENQILREHVATVSEQMKTSLEGFNSR